MRIAAVPRDIRRTWIGDGVLAGAIAGQVSAGRQCGEHDVGFVLKALPHRWRYRLAVAMNGERLRELRHPPKSRRWFLRAVDRFNYVAVSAFFNVFSLPKHSGVRGSFQFAGETADRGYSILVFPEGQLTIDGGILPFTTVDEAAARIDELAADYARHCAAAQQLAARLFDYRAVLSRLCAIGMAPDSRAAQAVLQ